MVLGSVAQGGGIDIAALLASALFVGAVVLGLQLADAVSAVYDARRVRDPAFADTDEPDSLTRRRIRELAWSIAITAVLAVIVAFGALSAVRLVWDSDRPVAGALALVGTTILVLLIGMVAIVAVVRRERPTYARIRRDLRDRSSFTLEADELAEFDERLERADRVRLRRSRASTLLRSIGVVLIVGLAVVVGVITPLPAGLPVVLGFAGGALLGVTAFVVAVRAGAIRTAALEAVLETQRAEVVALLERARIPQRAPVPGLRDRVSRALTILREQQK